MSPCIASSALCCAKLLQSYPNLCNPLDYSPPDFSVHEILQEGILESVPRPSPRGPSQPRNWTCVSLCLLHWQAGFFFLFFLTISATWETASFAIRCFNGCFISVLFLRDRDHICSILADGDKLNTHWVTVVP